MARTTAGATLTRQHRERQLRLRAATLRDLALLWPIFNPRDLSSWTRFAAMTTVMVRVRHDESSRLAASYYQAFGVAETGRQRTPRLARMVEAEKVLTSLRATGLAGTTRALRAGFSPQAALRSGFVRLSGAAGRHVLSGGRTTIIDSANADDLAIGWARVTGSEPCAFCAMLASRGPVYFSKAAADFKAHDHCMCGAEPHYEGAEWPGRAREFRHLWNEATRGQSDPLNAFRRALSA